MNTSRLLASIIAFFCLAGMLPSCVHPGSAKVEPREFRCGFSDPELTASMGICHLVAEYYVAHGEWPVTREQLAVQSLSLLESGQGDISDDEAVEISSFLNRFELLELDRKDENLVIRYRFKLEEKIVDQRVMLRPKATVDEIIQSATEAG